MEENRFENFDISVEDYVEGLENRSTKEKTERDVRLLKLFLTSQNEERELLEISPQELDKYLAEFIRSVRRKDGEDYEPTSLRSLIASFERHLKRKNYPASIINDREFELTRKCLQSKQKELKKSGKGNKDRAAVALTDSELDILYEKNLLGVSSAESILNTLWLNNTVHFGLRGCQEHRQMCWGDVKLCQDSKQQEYLEYNERQTKTRTGADTSNVRKVIPKMFSTGTERDPVAVYKIYREKRPENMLNADAPFYLGVNHMKKSQKESSNKNWFKSAPMGVNKLNSLMKTMATNAELSNERLTNHSARKRMMQKLNDKDIPPTHIMQLSGHKNLQSVNNYSTINLEQQRNMSEILSCTESKTLQKRTFSHDGASSPNNTAKPSTSMLKFFEGANITGGHFNISVNTVNSSPTMVASQSESFVMETKRKWKRIRQINDESDSD